MNRDKLRSFCLALPHATEDIKWESVLCFLIAKKMFAVTSLDEGNPVSFKCTPVRFAELVEVDGIIPAPYMAKNHWVALERWDALRDAELEDLIRESYALVVAKLPKRVQRLIAEPPKRSTEPIKHTSRRTKRSPSR